MSSFSQEALLCCLVTYIKASLFGDLQTEESNKCQNDVRESQEDIKMLPAGKVAAPWGDENKN